MLKTLTMIKTITDPMQVKIGDKAYFKGCDFGFTVVGTDRSNPVAPLKVYIPRFNCTCWPQPDRFDHAIRKFEELEWPDPQGTRLHVYLGADGRRYIYYPNNEIDMAPWSIDGTSPFLSRETMKVYHRNALPLTELKLVPAKDDDNEQ